VPVIYNIGKLARLEDLPKVLKAFENLEGDRPSIRPRKRSRDLRSPGRG